MWLTFGDGLAPQEAGVSVSVFFYVKKVGRQERRTTKSQSENRTRKGISHRDFFQHTLHHTEHRLYFHGRTATKAQKPGWKDPDLGEMLGKLSKETQGGLVSTDT